MTSRVSSDNPRARAQNQQMSMEKESNIRIDGLIDDSSIRFPFLKTEQGLLQFPENQLFCCDSRLAVLVADPGVKVTVLRRWDVDEKCTTTNGQETCATKSTEESSKTVINTSTKSAQREAGERKAEEAAERKAQEGDKFSVTTQKTINVNNGIVSSTPNLSAQSQSYKTTTKDNLTGNGSKFKTTETVQVENRSYCDEPEVPLSSDTSGISMSFRSSYEEDGNVVRTSSTKTAEKSKKMDASKPTGSSSMTTTNTSTTLVTNVSKPTGPSGMTTSNTSQRGTRDTTSKPKGPVETTEETSYSRATSSTKPTGPYVTTTSSTSQCWTPDTDTSNIAGPSRMTTEETTEFLDISSLNPTRPSFMTTSTISPCWAPPDTPTKPVGPSRMTTDETSESWSTTSTTKPKEMTTSNVSESWTTEMSQPIGPSRLTTLDDSQCWAPQDTSKPGGPNGGMTTEETSESWATSTPKTVGPSGATTTKTSQSFVTEITRPVGPPVITTSKISVPIGPSRVTTSKTSQSWSSTEKTTKKNHEQTIQGAAWASCVDNEESLEKALGSFVIYSRSVNFMNSCADDVLAMLEDDRINLRSERDAFRAVNEWILYDPVNRKQHAAKVMSGVRFSLMTLPELLRVVHASRYLFTIPEYRDQLLEAFIWRGACHCGYSEHFLDFEPMSRGEQCGHECQCQCHVPNSGQGVTGAEASCCCACHCQAPNHLSTDTIAAMYNRETEFRSNSL